MDRDGGSQSLVENFQKYFQVRYACSKELKEQIFQIRYRVYCKEFKYESAQSFPQGLEYDEYDEQSLHCLIVHKSTGRPAACVRLVPGSTIAGGNPEPTPLPLEKFCEQSLDKDFIDSLDLDRSSVCEISRLAVDGAFRRRSGETLTRFGDVSVATSPEEQRTFLFIAVAAFLGATVLTQLSGKTNVFAMMEPFLPRLLQRSGINFQRAGRDIDYHGIRAPYFIKTQSALDNMRTELLSLYQWIYTEIKKEYLCSFPN